MIKALTSLSNLTRAFTLTLSLVGLSAAVVAQSPPPAPVITSPLDGALSASTSVTISGTQDPTVITVEIFDGVTSLGMSTLGSGTFSLTTTLLDGVHVLTAVADDGLMNGTSTSLAVTVTVDTTSPIAPVIVSSTPNSPSNDTTPVIAGTSEANATITVSDGTSTIGTTTANGSGNWSVTVSAMNEGSYTLTATATDAAANVSNASSGFSLTIDTTAPVAPNIVNSNPTSPSNTATPVISGTAEVASSITLSDGTSTIGTGTADGSGNWSITVSTLLDGAYTVTATATDVATNVSVASTGLVLTVDTTAPTTPTNVLATTPTTTAPALSWTASTDVTTAVASYNVWRDDGLGANLIGTSATTNYTDSSLTIGGSYTYTVAAVDSAGNVSANSSGMTVVYSIPLPSNILTVGTNGTYATIDAALTAAAGLLSTDNAVIKVESGTYGEFTVNGLGLPQSVRIVADVGATVSVSPNSGPIAINQIAWTQSFEMVGVDITVGSYLGVPVVVTACDGTVHLRDGLYASTSSVTTLSVVASAQVALSNLTFSDVVSVATNSVASMNNVTGTTLNITNTSSVTGFGMGLSSVNADPTSSVISYPGAACNLSITPRFATQLQSISIDLSSGVVNAGQFWVLVVSASPVLHWNNNPVTTGSPLVWGASLIANSNAFIVDSRLTDIAGNDSIAVAGFTDPYFFGLPLVFQGVVLDAASTNFHVTTAATFIQLP